MQPPRRTPARTEDKRLALVTALLLEAGRAPGQLGHAAAYVLRRPGKHIRARLTLDLAFSLQVPAEQGIVLAAAVELLHNASLVLDDLQDNDEMRRGQAAAWRAFGPGQAISLGTFLIGQSFSLAAGLPGVGPLFASTLREATIGQSAEIDFHVARPSLDAYEKMAEAKTGALFALPARATAILARLPDDHATRAGQCFGRLGAAYQVQDDLADAFGLKGRARPGLDLREGKANSIVLFHLALRPEDEAPLTAFLRDSASRHDETLREEWLQRLFASGAVAATQEHLHGLCDEIGDTATSLPAPFAPHLAALAAGIREPAIFQRPANSTAGHGGL